MRDTLTIAGLIMTYQTEVIVVFLSELAFDEPSVNLLLLLLSVLLSTEVSLSQYLSFVSSVCFSTFFVVFFSDAGLSMW